MNPETDTPRRVALVIDDEPQIRRLLRVTLETHGYRVFDASTGNAGIAEAAMRRPDVVLLDLGLPDMDGLTVLKRLREWSRVPVVILSVREGEDEKVEALDAGADDYVTKPFGAAELLARLRAAQRHAQPPAVDAVVRSDDLEIDLASRVVRKRGVEVKLTPTEYALLRALVTQAGKVLTHRHLQTEVWGPAMNSQTHAMRVHIAHLREKLEDDPSEPRWIRTEAGVGYRWVGAD
jgi:two-component system KDP operon response regulator KdpE